jgi:hypothetical protein
MAYSIPKSQQYEAASERRHRSDYPLYSLNNERRAFLKQKSSSLEKAISVVERQ